MNQSSWLREFARYSSLNVLGMIGLSFYILADTFFVSQGLGTDGLAALNLAIPFYSMIQGTALMLGMGGGIRFAIQKHQGQEKINRIFTNTLYLGGVAAVIFLTLALVGTHWLVGLTGASGNVYEMTHTYLQVLLCFSPAFLLNNILLCFVRNDGMPQLAMAAMIGGSLSNVVLDYIFIFPCNMGIFGAVFATGLAPIISMAILSPFFILKKNHFRPTRCRLNLRLGGGILSGGLPSLITEISSGVVIMVFNTILLSLEGNTGVAAYGVIANLSLVVTSIYTGIAQGIQPILSTSYGRREIKKMGAILGYALITMGILSLAVYAGAYFGAEELTAIFNREGDQLLARLAVPGMRLYFLACPFVGFNIILSAYFAAVDRVRPAQVLSLLRGVVVIIPMAILLSRLWGTSGVWCSFPLTELVVSLAGLGVYLKRKTN